MEEQHQQHQQNDFDGSDVISQEDRAPTNGNVQQRKKWTKQMNENIIRCFYEITLRRPNESYRKEFHRRWKELYPNDSSTEQRICDQRSQITKRADANNIGRGNWLTSMEINQIKDQISRTITEEYAKRGEEQQHHDQQQPQEHYGQQQQQEDQQQQQQQNMDANEPEQADQQEPIEDIQQDEIKQQLMDEYAKCILIPFAERKFIKRPGKQHEKKLEKAVENVNKTLEVIPVSTEISDVTQLNNLLYASAITAIKIADLEKQCLPANKQQQKKKEWHVNFQIRIDNLRTEINKIMQISNTNQSAKMKKNANSMKNKYNIDTEEKRQITLETLRQRLKALNNRLSRYLKREKQVQQNKEFIEKPSTLFDQDRIIINSPSEKDKTINFWRSLFETEKIVQQKSNMAP